ncbi:HNH endonuclease signature motif containing protein [Actinocrispum sp. NPDC049592]|uniref:HNH endonuclease signature motif containing protein n=1 Tax=Actinocrispum sp. NPDC049592 TaxID=3154835 RepID=UPI00341D065F
MVLRDEGCAFPGCAKPASVCDAHHIQHWADNGVTHIDNLVLLCPHHHRLITTATGQSKSSTTARSSSHLLMSTLVNSLGPTRSEDRFPLLRRAWVKSRRVCGGVCFLV